MKTLNITKAYEAKQQKLIREVNGLKEDAQVVVPLIQNGTVYNTKLIRDFGVPKLRLNPEVTQNPAIGRMISKVKPHKLIRDKFDKPKLKNNKEQYTNKKDIK